MGKILNFVMTPARKLALKKAQRAAARAAKRKAVTIGRKKAIKKVATMKLARKAGGRVLRSNFRAGGKFAGQRRATYAARLASSRAKYKASSFRSKAGSAAVGLVAPTGVFRRRYSDLTLGENITRNVGRSLKVGAALLPVQAAIAAPSIIGLRRQMRQIERMYGASADSIKQSQETKYKKMST